MHMSSNEKHQTKKSLVDDNEIYTMLSENVDNGSMSWKTCATGYLSGERRTRYSSVSVNNELNGVYDFFIVQYRDKRGRQVERGWLVHNKSRREYYLNDTNRLLFINRVKTSAGETDAKIEHDPELSRFEKRKHIKEIQQLPNYSIIRLVIRNNNKYCLKNHHTTDVSLSFPVVNKKGKVSQIVALGMYCADCDTYYTTQEVFGKICDIGLPMVQVLRNPTRGKYTYSDFVNYNFKEESILHQCGYSVSKSKGLSTKQRWTLLQYIIDNGLVERFRIREYLTQFIYLNGSAPNMHAAVSKWEEDRDYVSRYKLNRLPKIDVSELKRVYVW